MKKVLLVVAGGISSLLATSQITLTHDYMATLGDTVFMSEDTVNGASLDLGTAAGNQVWDFTALVEHKPDGAILEDPSTAPLSSNFPEADFVVNDLEDDSMHLFFKQTDDYLDVIGLVKYDSAGNPTIPFLDLSWRFIQFPANFQDGWSSSELGQVQSEYLGIDPDSLGPHPTIDSLRSRIYFGFDNSIDAWGELQLPAGNWMSLRHRAMNVIEIRVDWYGDSAWRSISESSFLSLFIDSVSYDTGDVTYRWWGNNPAANFFLAEIEIDSLGNPDSSVSYLKGSPEPPLGMRTAADIEVSIFPNPAADVLTIGVQGVTSFSVNMMDVEMRNVWSETSLGTQLRADVSAIPSGVYLLQVKDEFGTLIELQKVQIVH